VIGRDAVAAVARTGTPAVARLAGDVAVGIDPAARYLSDPDAGCSPLLSRGKRPPPESRAAVERVLAFVPPRPREVTTTPTALATFRRCPRQYWYRHVLGLDESGVRGRRARLAGMLAHGVLEQVDYTRPLGPDTLAALARTRPESLQLGARQVRRVLGDLAAATALVRSEIAAGLRAAGARGACGAGGARDATGGRRARSHRRPGAPPDALVVQDYKHAEASEPRALGVRGSAGAHHWRWRDGRALTSPARSCRAAHRA
jgi:hypothetical protein